MPQHLTVLVATADVVSALEARLLREGDVLSFTETEVVPALAAIVDRRPPVVALGEVFAAAHRGVALIDRIAADPALVTIEIRILSDGPGEAPIDGRARARSTNQSPGSVIGDTIDQHGTRRAQRYRVVGPLVVVLDGTEATLVDLSVTGAQALSPTVLRPNQRVRAQLSDHAGSIRLSAQVAWASFEIPSPNTPRYRVGLVFLAPDTEALELFCRRHGEEKEVE